MYILIDRGIGMKSYSGTRFYQDRSIPEIAELELSIGNRHDSVILKSPQTQGSLSTRTPRLMKRLSLAELLNEDFSTNERTNYKCVAEIVDFFDTLEWYKIFAVVTDGTETAIFTLMGQVVEQIVGYPASTVAREDQHDSDDLPEKIKAILHQRYMFTVNVNKFSLQKSKPEFTVQQMEPVPPNAPNFLTRMTATSTSAVSLSGPKRSPYTTQTTLTPQTECLTIATASHKSEHPSFGAKQTSPGPKRKIKFESEDELTVAQKDNLLQR